MRVFQGTNEENGNAKLKFNSLLVDASIDPFWPFVTGYNHAILSALDFAFILRRINELDLLIFDKIQSLKPNALSVLAEHNAIFSKLKSTILTI